MAVALGGEYEIKPQADLKKGKKPERKFEQRGSLLLFSITDGKRLGEMPLSGIPRWDGMAAAGGSLFLTTEDGKVLCLQKDSAE